MAPDGVRQAAPAPRFSRTPATLPGPPAEAEDVETVLADWALIAGAVGAGIAAKWPYCNRTGAGPRCNAGAGTRRHPAAHSGRRGAGRVFAQPDGVSSTSRLRVRFGSTGMPGPVVVETVTFFR